MDTTRFNPEMLVVARESRGMIQEQLATAAGIEQGTLSKFESGQLPVSGEMLSRLAQVLQYPVSFFFRSDRVYGFNSSVFFHRRRAMISEKELRKIHAQINVRRFNIRNLLRSASIESPYRFSPLDVADFGGRVDRLASMVRGMWHVPKGPIRNVTRLIEDAGGLVMKVDFGTKKLDAISEWVPDHPPLVFINSSSEITGDRLRMTLCHEIGHLVMHQFGNAEMEKQANRFAGELLMPAREIKPYLNKLTIPKLADIKSEWKVSMAAIIERAYELGSITDSQRRYLILQLNSRGYRLREPEETDVPIEQPSLVPQIIDAHMGQLGYSRSSLASLVDLAPEEFSELFLHLGKIRLVG